MRYVWAHPSWRDLVIAQLMESGPERRRFLGRCGIDGLELATSSAGGERGTRIRPLLQTERDWSELAGSAVRLASTDNLSMHRRLLVTIDGLRRMTVSEPEIAKDTTALIGQVLDRLLCTWNKEEAVIPPDVLEMFYELSVVVHPLRQSPELGPSWRAHTAPFSGRFARSRIAGYEAGIAFVGLLAANEPRALRQQQFPETYGPRIARLLAGMRQRGRHGDALLTEVQTRRSWGRQARALSGELLRWRQLAKMIQGYVPRLEHEASIVAAELSRVEMQLEASLRERQSDRLRELTYADYLLRRDVRRTAPPDPDAQARSVEAMFTTL